MKSSSVARSFSFGPTQQGWKVCGLVFQSLMCEYHLSGVSCDILMCSTCHRIVVDVWHTVVFRHAYRVVVIVWMVSIGLLMLVEFERASLVFLQLSHFRHPRVRFVLNVCNGHIFFILNKCNPCVWFEHTLFF